MSNWSDMPVVYDSFFPCTRCCGTTQHHCVAYKDVEYRTCTRCHTKTEWIPNTDKQLEKKKEERPDTSVEDYDFKRAANRKYKKRRK